jgi:transposase
MPRTHRPYPPEFRAEAVRLARGSDKSIPVLAADLGGSSTAMRHWLRQADADAGRGQPGDRRPTNGRTRAGCAARTMCANWSGRS